LSDGAFQSTFTSQPNVSVYKDDTRNFKGYWFEIHDSKPKIEAIPNISYQSNPSNYEDWKSENQKNKYDGIVTLPSGEIITLEFKRRDCPKVYHSWFMQCWYPREADWIITNNTQCISYSDRRLLEAKGKKILSLSEAIVEIGRLVENILHPRKYLYFNSLITNIFNNILELTRIITSKIRKFEFKIRLKIRLFSLKSSLGARFSKSQLKLRLPLCLNMKLSSFLDRCQLIKIESNQVAANNVTALKINSDKWQLTQILSQILGELIFSRTPY
jgi:hypothetical protein